MNNILKGVGLSLLLVVGLSADDKNFSFEINPSENLKVGDNKMEMHVKNRSAKISNAKINLAIFQDGKKVAFYKNIKANKDKKYLLNANFKEKGNYTYLSTFNMNGGVIHKRKGELKVEN